MERALAFWAWSLIAAAVSCVYGCGGAGSETPNETINYELVEAANPRDFRHSPGSRMLVSTGIDIGGPAWISIGGRLVVRKGETPPDAQFLFEVMELELRHMADPADQAGDVVIEGQTGRIIGAADAAEPLQGEVTVVFRGEEVDLTVQAVSSELIAEAVTAGNPPGFRGLALVGVLAGGAGITIVVHADPQ